MLESFYTHPPLYDDLCDAIATLRKAYPDLKTFPIGKSVLGREINALCIGNPMNATVFFGATHGLEWLTTLLLMHFCQDLLEGMKEGKKVSDIDVRKAMQSRSLVIIPCLNPDGVQISLTGQKGAGILGDFVEEVCGGNYDKWQANAHGVDINHNFDAGWCILKEMEIKSGIDRPAPTRYGGPHPNSEPETNAATTFCMTYQPRTLYSFHSQGEEIFYKYGKNTPQRSQLMAQILASSSGYKIIAPEGLNSHGGLKDWFIQRFRRPGFTIEIGLGKNPLPVTQLDSIYPKLQEMMIIDTLL